MADADKRLQDLLEKWLASLAAHRRYTVLTDEAYWRVQPWSPHERPTRWIIDLAETRTRDLAAEAAKRREAGDSAFAEAMEAMLFLANLVAVEHISRFIPLADPAHERIEPAVGTRPVTTAAKGAGVAGSALVSLLDGHAAEASPIDRTREMPVPVQPGAADTRQMPRLRGAPSVADTREMPMLRAPRRNAGDSAAKPQAPPAQADDIVSTVIADAIRLRKWGREWHELAPTIARMAGRPASEEVRRILRTHKAEIEAGSPRRPAPPPT
jgi:hypothetical protein